MRRLVMEKQPDLSFGEEIRLRYHPEFGYDLSAVPGKRCLICGSCIGDEEYVEVLTLARFGQMLFRHSRCGLEG